MNLKYNTHRKKREYHDDHPLTRKQRRKEARLRRIQQANLADDAFGKVNWAAYEHRQLWDMIKSAKPAEMGQRAYQWAELASNVDSATAEVRKTLQDLLLSWRGKSAVQAAASTTRLTTWASDASQTARHIGDGLDTYTAAVGEAKKKIPEPVHPYLERWFREGYDVSALHGPNGAYMMNQLLDDHLPTKREATQAKQEAVRVMEEYESASKTVHSTLPGFKSAPAASGGGQQHVDSATPASPGGHGEGGIDDSTSASSVLQPSFGTDAGYGPGTGSLSGIGGAGYGQGAGGTSGPGMSSGSGPAGGMVPGGAAASAANAAGARGGGLGGGFGMYPPMAGAGNRDGDTEHTNKYDLGMDLLDDLPPAYPPVFGE